MAGETVIEVRDVHKRYRIYRQRFQSVKEILVHRRLGVWEEHWALRGLNLDVKQGTTLALVGPNGAGKSTTLKLMARILTPDQGSIRMAGRVSGLLELGAGFQLEYTGRENIYLNASLLGLRRKQIDERLDSIIEFSELERSIDDPLRTYSSGMYMRLAFAIAIHVDPEVLLVDEILAVGDQSFQQKCLDWIAGFQGRGGTIVMVTHNLGVVQEMCNEAAWIEDGELLDLGPPTQVVNSYVDRAREKDSRRRQELRASRAAAGTPDVELGKVEILDRHGKPAGAIELGDPLTLEIEYRVHQRLQEPCFGVALFRNDGVHLYGTNTVIDGIEVPPLERDGSIRLEYRSIQLLAGTYRLSVGVFEGRERMRPLDFHDKLYGFRVVSGTDEEGLVRLDHAWRLERSERPERKRASR